MYGGLASTELATINDALISKSRSFGETLKKSSPFEAMMEQVLSSCFFLGKIRTSTRQKKLMTVA